MLSFKCQLSTHYEFRLAQARLLETLASMAIFPQQKIISKNRSRRVQTRQGVLQAHHRHELISKVNHYTYQKRIAFSANSLPTTPDECLRSAFTVFAPSRLRLTSLALKIEKFKSDAVRKTEFCCQKAISNTFLPCSDRTPSGFRRRLVVFTTGGAKRNFQRLRSRRYRPIERQ